MQKIIFVADKFSDEYLGGAELSTDALMSSANRLVDRIHAKVITPEYVFTNEDAYFIITNFADMREETKQALVKRGRYAIVEYDFKICEYRCPEWHQYMSGKPCECVCNEELFMYADIVFFMSQKQRQYYDDRIAGINGVILSSIFHNDTLDQIKTMNCADKEDHYLVVYSPSFVKGARETVKYCVENGIDYRMVSNLTYAEMLAEFAKAKGYVYMPAGQDTCPRAVIEAKLLGCELIVNDNVLHADEYWFNTDDDLIYRYLETRTDYFWTKIHEQIKDLVENTGAHPCG